MLFCFLVSCGQTKEFYSFVPGCVRPGLQLVVLCKSDWNEYPLHRVWIGRPYFFQNQFYEENKNTLKWRFAGGSIMARL